MGRRVVFSKEQYEEIEKLYKSRVKTGELCRRFGVSQGFMLKILKERGVYCYETIYFSDEEYEEIESLYSSGFSIEDIAIKFKVDRHALSGILSRRGVKVTSRRVFTPEQLSEMSRMYANGSVLIEISKKFNCSVDACRRGLREYGVQIRKCWDYRNSLEISEDKISLICDKYKEGASLKDLPELIGIGVCRCRGILEKNGFNIRHTTRKYKVNEEYFNIIDKESKAYWLGFLMGDGGISNFSAVVLNLKGGDVKQLEKFRDCLDSEHPIIFRKKNLNGKVFEQCSINVGSKKMCDRLNELGVTPNKTFTARPCSEIPTELEKHFWRGAVDSDGWVLVPTYGSKVGLCGSKYMVEGFLDFIKRSGIETKTKVRKIGNIYAVALSGRGKPLELADLLYSDSTIYLDRKYENYHIMKKGRQK